MGVEVPQIKEIMLDFRKEPGGKEGMLGVEEEEEDSQRVFSDRAEEG